jgi:hypothetical protein
MSLLLLYFWLLLRLRQEPASFTQCTFGTGCTATIIFISGTYLSVQSCADKAAQGSFPGFSLSDTDCLGDYNDCLPGGSPGNGYAINPNSCSGNSESPTVTPTAGPSNAPTVAPSYVPTFVPSGEPTFVPTAVPTVIVT